MHPHRERLVAWLDGELDEAAAAGIAAHLAACDDCTAACAELRESLVLLAVAVSTVDAGEPDAWRTATFDAAGTGRTGIARSAATPTGDRMAAGSPAVPPGAAVAHSPATRRRRRRLGAWRWAAGIMLLTAAAGSAAVIAFPALLRPDAEPTLTTLSNDAADVRAAAQPAAVVVGTPDGAVAILLSGVADGTPLVVARGGTDDVVVEITGRTTPRFEARDGRVAADLGGEPASVHVTLPATLMRGTISVDGRVVARMDAGRLTPEEVAADGIVLRAHAQPR